MSGFGAPGIERARLTRLGWVPVIASLVVSVATALVVIFGPAPTQETFNLTESGRSLVGFDLYGLVEPSDRVILVLWFFVAMALALSFSALTRPGAKPLGHRKIISLTSTAVFAVGFSLTVFSVTWTWDETNLVDPLELTDLGFGLLFATLVLWLLSTNSRASVVAAWTTAGLVTAISLPAWLQTPASIRDLFHFRFTSEELIAPAAGLFPFADFIPQYTALLGVPLVPLIGMWPSHTYMFVVGWILMLQLLALFLAIALPVRIGGRRILVPAAAIVLLLSLAPTVREFTLGQFTYFANAPLRIVLPMVSIAVCLAVLTEKRCHGSRFTWGAFALGAVLGITVFNNSDFGIPAALAVFVTGLIPNQTFKKRFLWVGLILSGMTMSGMFVLASSWLAGRSIDWRTFFIFQQVFALEGFNNVAMRPFGVHIAVATLFISACAIGFVLIRRSGVSADDPIFRQGVLLTLTGGWALLTLPYFAGRSLVPTLFGGYAFSVALVAAAFLPLVATQWQRLLGETKDVRIPLNGAVAGLAMAVLMLAAVGSQFTRLKPPSDYFALAQTTALSADQLLREESSRLSEVLERQGNEAVARAVEQGEVGQLARFPAAIGVTSDLPSVSVFSSPEYVGFGGRLADLQCDSIRRSGLKFIVASRDLAAVLLESSQCSGLLSVEASPENGDYRILRTLEIEPSRD